ncbi:MAG: glycosyltransferase family 4 protein [Candidatus Omnitrophota bacterium]
MNILILATHFNTGGITSYVFSIAKGFVQKGHRVYVVTSGGDREKELKDIGVFHITLDIKTKSELSFKIYRSIPKVVNIVKQNHIDIIHTQTRVTQVLAAFVSSFTKVPYLLTCHGFFIPKLARKIFPCWGKAVIAISDQVEEHLKEDLGCPVKKISSVPHGLDIRKEVWDETKKKEQRQALKLNSGPVVGIVARLSEVKGQDVLIKAMKKVVERSSNVNLVLAGEGKWKEHLVSLVKELGLERHVFFLPTTQSDQNILPLFDIFVMPSRQEGLGLSVMEAQAQGLAVIASDVGGLPTLVEDGKTGLLVPKENVERLAQAIMSLIENPQQRVALGESAHHFINKKFPFEKMISQTLAVYEKVIADEKNSCCQR